MSSSPSALVVVTTELVSQPAAIANLKEEFSGYEVHQQLLERLEENAVQLPHAKYSRVHVASGTLSARVSDALFASMQSNGEITGSLAASRPVLTIAGFVPEGENRWIKKELGQAPVQLRKRPGPGASSGSAGSGAKPLRRFAKVSDQPAPRDEKDEQRAPLTPPGDDLIDEDELVEGFDIKPAIVFPEKCDPGPGKKRRRACKDCTCGLKEQEEQEQDALESSRAVLLDQDEMAEIDFTVPGKAVGGCGSCALGDAFRCDGCPYIGLPPFKPGQVVSLDQFGDDF